MQTVEELNAFISALQKQRNTALNALAQAEAKNLVLSVELAALKAPKLDKPTGTANTEDTKAA